MKRSIVSVSAVVIALFMVIAAVDTASAEWQPMMQKALRQLQMAKNNAVGNGKVMHLKEARKALAGASADKGGHRVAAINFIDKALFNIKKGRIARANEFIQRAINQVKLGRRHDNVR